MNGIRKELVNARKAEVHMAELKHRQAAGQINSQDHIGVEGLGQCVMRVGVDAFYYWGHREGFGCWQDKGFRREFMRDNESVRVRNVPRTASIIVP